MSAEIDLDKRDRQRVKLQRQTYVQPGDNVGRLWAASAVQSRVFTTMAPAVHAC